MATISYSSLYSSAGAPVKGRPKSSNLSPNPDSVAISLATTDLDLAADFHYAIPVRSGKLIEYLDLGEWTDLDSGGNALDMDIVLRTTDSAGAHTDAILFNAGTWFTAAQTAGAIYRVWCRTRVPDDADGVGHIGFKVNVAANAAAAGTGQLYAHVV